MSKLKTATSSLLLGAPLAAQAHPALHDGGFLQNLAHFLTEPDHLLAIAALASAGYLLFRYSTRRN